MKEIGPSWGGRHIPSAPRGSAYVFFSYCMKHETEIVTMGNNGFWLLSLCRVVLHCFHVIPNFLFGPCTGPDASIDQCE